MLLLNDITKEAMVCANEYAEKVGGVSRDLNGRCAATMGSDRQLIAFTIEILGLLIESTNKKMFDLEDRYADIVRLN